MSINKSYVPRETFHSTYFGCNIYRYDRTGMYTSFTSDGTRRADTLDGIKELIREVEKKKPK